jgi:hypothetical protein
MLARAPHRDGPAAEECFDGLSFFGSPNWARF